MGWDDIREGNSVKEHLAMRRTVFGSFVRMSSEVGIHRDDDRTLRIIDSSHHRSGLTKIAAEVDHLEIGLVGSKRFQ